MIKIEKTHVVGFEDAIRGARNPMNSHVRSDSFYTHLTDCENGNTINASFYIGDNDLDLMIRLSNAGPDHAKYRRMIAVYVDITAPFYWWKEFDTYKVGTVANSCSTMHKIHDKPFTLSDFSHEHLYPVSKNHLAETILLLERFRKRFNESKDKSYWDQMIQLLPMSYNQKRTVMLNYEVLANMYKSRKNHKLNEWRELCKWIEELPYSELITGEKKVEEDYHV